MKLKKVIVTFLLTILSLYSISLINSVNAAISNPGKDLTITEFREDGYGHRVLEKNVWEIVETSSPTGGTIDHSSTIYCLKGGPGFGSADYSTAVKTYTRYFNMKDSTFTNSNDAYRNALPTNSNTYKALLWVLEHAYLPPSEAASSTDKQEAQEYKEKLLTQAGVDIDYLTDDDIDVVQQLAIWHFTNMGDDNYDVGEEGNFDMAVNVDVNDNSNYISLSDEFYWSTTGRYRQEDAQSLYLYLINTATEAVADGYEPQTVTQPYELANLTQTLQESGSNYIIGPFRIEAQEGAEGTIEGEFTDGIGNPINNYTLRSSNGSSYTTYNSFEDTVGNEFYLVVPNTTNIDTITFTINVNYYNTTVTYWSVEGADSAEQPVAIIEREEEEYSDDTTFVKPEDEIFDLALRKFIVSINNNAPSTSRVPSISSNTLEELANGTTTTAEKIHTKTPLVVETGDSVIYTIRVYNEGNVNAKVTEITDYLPDGLTLKTGSSINTQYGWQDNRDGTVTTNYLENREIQAFDEENPNSLHYLDVQIECEVTARVQEEDTSLRNIAEITGATDSEGEDRTDRDSEPGDLTDDEIQDYNPNPVIPGTGYEDDDDYEDLVMPGKYFDLVLRKYITNIDGEEVARQPEVDTTQLVSGASTTAIYNHDKTPLGVKVGDEIIYTIRVYNEGQLNGYATEITDHLPEGLEFVNDSFNTQRGWNLQSDGRTVKTETLADELIEAFNGTTLDYVEVQIKCRIASDVTPGSKLTNIAEISGFTDEDGYEVTDRDSQKDNVTLPSDNTLPNYKDTEINRGDEYIPGQQDDDDFEKVIVERFDLALRKFITGVNAETVTNREPVFSIEDGEYTYTHTKDPVSVKSGDTIIYTLRIYNEGDIAGYAEEVKDDIPEGLEFLPNNTTNINYRWVMYDVDGDVTENVSEAVTIRTDYLSKAQEDETSRDNLIEAFNPDTMDEPDYKEIRVAFRVTEPNSSDRVIINTAEISEDADEDGEPIDDEDSTPDNDEEEEDDIDIEKVIVEEFDLALRKFITSITSADGTQVTPENREPQITIDTINDLVNGNTTTLVKTHEKDAIQVTPGDRVVYTIRVYNEGTIAGYATEITDYLPEGLRFIADSQINIDNGWSNPSGDGKTIVTTALADNLLSEVEGTNVTYIDLQIECEVVAEYGNTETSLKNVAEITGAATNDGKIVPTEIGDRDSIPDNLTEEQIGNYNPTPYPYKSESGEGYEDDDDYEELVIPAATGDYELKLIKVNGLGNKLSGATFKVEELNEEGDVIATYEGLTTNESGEVVTDKIAVSGEGTRIFVITEENAPDGYELLGEPIRLEVTVELIDRVYTVTNAKATRAEKTINENNLQGQNYNVGETLATTISLETESLNVEREAQTVIIENGAVKSIVVNDNTIEVTIENSYFDLALRKFITSITSGEQVATPENRVPQISDETKQNLFNRTITTAGKTHTKEPLQVNTGDSIIYTIRVYNEGEIAGYATEITDYLPNGLSLKEGSTINAQYGWVAGENGKVTTDITSPNTTNANRDTIYADRKAGEDKVIIDAFDGTTLDYIDVQIECEVTASKGETELSLKNVAEITGDLDKDKNEVEDRDSIPDNLTDDQKNNYNPGTSEQGWGYEDDDDYEEVILPAATGDFDLKLIKINGFGNSLQNVVFKVEEVDYNGSTINIWENLTTNENGEVIIENIAIEGQGSRTFVITEEQAPEGYTLIEDSIIIQVQISLVDGKYVVIAKQMNNESNEYVKDIKVTDNTIEITIENSYFDLSLRKFITRVNEEEITNRVPVFSIVDGEYIYTHTKDPVEVSNGDIVIYTLRIYNEGEKAGYAEEVKDDIPEGLEFLPDNEINTEYRWIMYDANGNVTENVDEAVSIRTDYLSKAQESETGRDNMIKAFNPETMNSPDYKDLQIAFRVTEPNTSDRILINTAEVSEDSDEDGEPVDDIDSTPDNDEDGEDDIDKEQVKVTYFDLALKKIISEVTMTLDGKTEIKETGHSYEDNPEEVVKIELGRHKIEDAVIKFTYQIRITNEGNKAGYAYEIKDYVPEGLEFVAEDNNEHWTLSEDGKTVTSDELAETLLEPGESAEIEITLRWINGHNNLGVKTNWAEISEDSDDDIDSTPDNFEMGEDDIDDAEVVLSVNTGIGEHYGIVITAVLAVLAGGTILIKKFVL